MLTLNYIPNPNKIERNWIINYKQTNCNGCCTSWSQAVEVKASGIEFVLCIYIYIYLYMCSLGKVFQFTIAKCGLNDSVSRAEEEKRLPISDITFSLSKCREESRKLRCTSVNHQSPSSYRAQSLPQKCNQYSPTRGYISNTTTDTSLIITYTHIYQNMYIISLTCAPQISIKQLSRFKIIIWINTINIFEVSLFVVVVALFWFIRELNAHSKPLVVW